MDTSKIYSAAKARMEIFDYIESFYFLKTSMGLAARKKADPLSTLNFKKEKKGQSGVSP